MRVPFLDLPKLHSDLWPQFDAAWHDISRSGHFIGGGSLERFEEEWANYCGSKHCVAVANGTVAIQLALEALELKRGHEVIVPTNTFFGTVEAVVAAGATPVFVDVEEHTLLMNVRATAEAISAKTSAIIAVHLYGQPVDMSALLSVARAAGIPVIEDAAQAHGSAWNGKRAGTLGDVGCFSFYPGKNLGAFGDAGAVVTDDLSVAERVRSLSNHGRPRDNPFRSDVIGGTHRMDSLQAAVLSTKLLLLDDWNEQRRTVAEWYHAELSGEAVELTGVDSRATSNYHLFVIQCDHRDIVREKLARAGIGTSVHYPVPCHLQPALALGENAGTLPVAERAAGRIISLPMSPILTRDDVAFVSAELKRAVGSCMCEHEA